LQLSTFRPAKVMTPGGAITGPVHRVLVVNNQPIGAEALALALRFAELHQAEPPVPAPGPEASLRATGALAIPYEGCSIQDDDTVVLTPEELREAVSAGTGRQRSAGAMRPGHTADEAAIIRAAETYARSHGQDPRARKQWAEAAPAVVQALFCAIRDSTPRDEEEGTELHLHDLAPELQDLLELGWPVWHTAA
jgi:hypothetical protein